MFQLFLMEPYSICEFAEIFHKITTNIFAALFISILHFDITTQIWGSMHR
jgi:hypothetical protein